MLRKLILLAIGFVIVKKLTENSTTGAMRSPFPTSSRPPEGYNG